MKASSFLLLLSLLTVSGTASVTITPNSNGGAYCLSPAFGPATCTLTSQYGGAGLMLSSTEPTSVFSDPPNAWGGVNKVGNVDLLSPIGGWLVIPGTSISATTNAITVEAGYAADGTIELFAYDLNGNLLGTAFNGEPLGLFGRTTMSVNTPGIHSFVVTGTSDTWGVDDLIFDALTPASVPEPGGLLTWATGVLACASALRRQISSVGVAPIGRSYSVAK